LENQLLALLEYRNVLGALTTSLDGLLVASAAVDPLDAELIAASTAGYSDDEYHSLASVHGSLHILRGRELRLIVLAEPGTDEARLHELMSGQLELIEESIRV
jgi:hypothetical protein